MHRTAFAFAPSVIGSSENPFQLDIAPEQLFDNRNATVLGHHGLSQPSRLLDSEDPLKMRYSVTIAGLLCVV